MSILRSIAMILFAALALCGASPASASMQQPDRPRLPQIPVVDGKRIALVIGNSDYQATDGWKKLDNAKTDAQYVANALQNLSDPGSRFEVILLTDQTHDQLAAALEDFSLRAATADISLIYYAGHGFQFKGQNYIVPVDAKSEVSENFIDREHIPFANVSKAATARKLTLFFLDACRTTDAITPTNAVQNNVNQAVYFGAIEPQNSSVIYAAGGGEPAYDAASANGQTSPFAQAVINYLNFPGLELSDFYTAVAFDVKKATSSFNPKQFPLSVARRDSHFYFLPQLSDRTPARRMMPNAPMSSGPEADVEQMPASLPATRGGGGPVNPLPTDVGSLPRFEPLDIAEMEDVLVWGEPEEIVFEALAARSLKQLGVLSAQNDDPLADYVLGMMYLEGLMLEADEDKAFYHFEKSAEAGSAIGLYGLAWMIERLYAENRLDLSAEDEEELKRLYFASHEGGFTRATLRIAEAYADEIITPPADRPDDNLRFWQAGAAVEHPRSMYELIIRGHPDADQYSRIMYRDMNLLGDEASALWLCKLTDQYIAVQAQVEACLFAAQAGEIDALEKLTFELMERDDVEISDVQAQNWARTILSFPDIELTAEQRAELESIANGNS